MDLNGKTALVTGGAVRVGRAITLALAEAGCHIFLHYGRSAPEAAQTKKDAEAFGVTVHTYSANLIDPEATEKVMDTAVAHFGQIDILINNAAIFPGNDTFMTTDLALWNRLFAVNLRAPFLLSRAFARQIAEDGHGKIINLNDNRVRRPAPDHFTYRFTKGSLWQMTEMLALELAPRITVNGVALGAILPGPDGDWDTLEQHAQDHIPLGRPGDLTAVTDTILHLLRHDFLTGVTHPIDGGEFV